MSGIPKIDTDDQVLVAYPRSYSGPGWSNTLTHVIIRDSVSGKLREESLQPEELDYATRQLLGVAIVVNGQFTKVVEDLLRGTGPRVSVLHRYEPEKRKR